MQDSYLKFANTGFGARLTAMLGLPHPLVLQRYQPGQPPVAGSVLLGGGGAPRLLAPLATAFSAMGAQTLAHAGLPQWLGIANDAGLLTGRWGVAGQPGEKVRALVFDATGLEDSTQSESLYAFFHDAARSILPLSLIHI